MPLSHPIVDGSAQVDDPVLLLRSAVDNDHTTVVVGHVVRVATDGHRLWPYSAGLHIGLEEGRPKT